MRRGEGEGGGGLLSPPPSPPYTQEPALEKPWLAWGRLGGLLHP